MKILFLAANPESTSRLNLEREAREIQDAIDSSELSSEFELIQRWEVRPKDFRRALLRYQPDIVHFSGHGSGETSLIISDEAGASKEVSGDALAGLFAAFPMVKCVLLNACYAEVQAKAIVQHVDYVIGMKDTIYDKAAIAFSIGFYDSLGYGRNFEEAFALGSNAILWEYDNSSGRTREEPRKLISVEAVLSKLPEHLKPVLLTKDSLGIPEAKPISIPAEPIKPDGKQVFLERVAKYVAERKLTPIAKFQLINFAKKQGLAEDEANQILDSEISKIEQAKLQYKELLEATIAAGLNPLDPETQQELKGLQKELGLINEEVAEISQIGSSNGKTTKQEDDVNRAERVIHIHQGNYNENVQGDYIQGDNTGNRSSANSEKQEESRDTKKPETTEEDQKPITSKIQEFSFEVITVDEFGKENSRKTREAEFYREELGNNVFLDMVRIPGGEFMMGSPEGEGHSDEKPQHKIKVVSFWMGKYPVTQAEWQKIMGNNPSRFKENPQNPMETVSWDEAKKFCQQLSQITENKYRLPSEAEWEYACRAGTTTPFHFGETISTEVANYDGNYTFGKGVKGKYRKQTTPVDYFQLANNFGLSDMHGNVWEWCKDNWQNNYKDSSNNWMSRLIEASNTKVMRGGSWYSNPHYCRSAIRKDTLRGERYSPFGFRVVCVAPRTT